MRLAFSLLSFVLLFAAALAVARTSRALARAFDEGEARRILERLSSEGQPPYDAIHEAKQRTEEGWLESRARVRHDARGEYRVDVDRLVLVRDGERTDLLASRGEIASPGEGRGPRGDRRRAPGGWAGHVYRRQLEIATRIEDIDLALANYRVEVARERGIAGRPCARLVFRSPGRDRPTRELSVDEVTGLVLSASEWAIDGELVSSFRVRSVEYRVLEESEMAREEWGRHSEEERRARHPWAAERREVPVDRLAREVDFPVFFPRTCPRGFRLERASVLFGRAWRKVQLDFTDGLCRLQLVERPIEEDWYEMERTMEGAALPPEYREEMLARMRFHEAEERAARSDAGGGLLIRRGTLAGMTETKTEMSGVRVVAVGPIPSKELGDWIDSMEPLGGDSSKP
ncbi:MAG: hypothetical protein HY720_14510 [Planctomycetes bacterium]|nr:hypothetical protein [Planctomycetota bacterium]